MAFRIPLVFLTGVCPQLDNIHFVFWSHSHTGCEKFWLMFPLCQASGWQHHSNAANREAETDEGYSTTEC